MADGSWKSGLLVCFHPLPFDAIPDSGSYAEKSPESHLISLLGVFGFLGLNALEKDVILAAGLIGLAKKGPNDNSRHYLLGSLAPGIVFLSVIV